MAISKKLKFKLIELGMKLLADEKIARQTFEERRAEDLNDCFGNLEFRGAPKPMWIGILDILDNYNHIDVLIRIFRDEFPRNQEIMEAQREFESQSIEGVIEFLKEIIQAKNFVLFIGPELLKCKQDDRLITFSRAFSKHITKELDKRQVFYEKEQSENLSYVIDCLEHTDRFVLGQTERMARDFFNTQLISQDIFQIISRLDVPLIINTNPDSILKNIMGESAASGFYDSSNNNVLRDLKAANISQEALQNAKTLIYNIYGSFDSPSSIIFTEKEAVDFTRRVYEKNPPIPVPITEAVKSSYGLFIGFDFHEWHFKILFDVLELRDKPENFALIDFNSTLKEQDKEYFERYYDMRFVKNSTDSFITLMTTKSTN
jgi:hypothetical protein